MKRAKHTLSHYRMVTAKMGELFPIGCVPVLPGDTFQHDTMAMIRVSPLNTPVMHPCSVRIHHFFVPNRIVWPQSENGGWEEFITGGPDGNNSQTVPTRNTTGAKKSWMTYLGVPPQTGPQVPVNALPLRGANRIFNEYYRDQDLVTARAEDDLSVPYIAWEKDYLTTARPWTQKGTGVTLPLAGQAPIYSKAGQGQLPDVWSEQDNAQRYLDSSGSTVSISTSGSGGFANRLVADLGGATGLDINTFRAGFAIQRYQEARARYGSRFTEYLRYLGITPSDARLQRPEYLAGGSTRLNFSEVLQTTPSANPGVDPGVGDLYGHGIAGVRSNAYRKFFEEHGYVISFMSVRPKSIYLNGVHRDWLKTTKEDYFQKELVHLGQQEVTEQEVAIGSTAGTVFGYQDRYDEYRSHQSQVSQDFRDVLNSWHLGRDLPAGTTLNGDFVECKPSDRIYQVQTNDHLWIMINHRIVARRLVPKVARPRIL